MFDMQCPKDHVSMKTVTFGAHEIDVCPECGGVWLDLEELKRTTDILLSSYEKHREEITSLINLNDSKNISLNHVAETGVVCPVDSSSTERSMYAGDSGISIDRCTQCGGVWFDGDEIVKLAEYLKPGAQDLLGEYMLQTEKQNKEELKKFKNMMFFPLRIGALFATPVAVLAEIVFFILHRTDIDLGTDISKYLPHRYR